MQSPQLTSGHHCTKLRGETKVQFEPLRHKLSHAFQAVQAVRKHFIVIAVIKSYFHLRGFK